MTSHRPSHRASRVQAPLSALSRAAVLLALTLGAVACGDASKPGDDTQDTSSGSPTSSSALPADELLRLRELAAGQAIESQFDKAAGAIDRIVAAPDAAIDDLVDAAIVHWELSRSPKADHDAELKTARTLLDRADAASPGRLEVRYLRGILALNEEFDPEGAAGHFEAVVAARPDDLFARLNLAQAYEQSGRWDDAIAQLEAVRAHGLEKNPSVYASATYKLAQDLFRYGGARSAEGRALLDGEVQEHQKLGIKAPAIDVLERGELLMLAWPSHAQLAAGPASSGVPPTYETPVRVALPARAQIFAADLDGDGRTDLVGRDGARVSVAQQTGAGVFRAFEASVDGATSLRDLDAGDLDGHGDGALELVAVAQGADGRGVLRLFDVDVATGTLTPRKDPPAADAFADIRSATLVDYDHDGDLDLLLVTSVGARVLRRDAIDADLWSDGTPEAIVSAGPCRDVIVEDFDGDNDVDVVLLRETGGPLLLSSLRNNRFEDVTARRLSDASSVGPTPRMADVNADHLPDLLERRGDDLLVRPSTPTGFGSPETFAGVLANAGDDWTLDDVDSDGQLDVLVLHPTGDASPFFVPGPLARRTSAPNPRVLDDVPSGVGIAADVLGLEPTESGKPARGDGKLELAVVDGDGVSVLRPAGKARGISLTLEGLKDNARGVGSVIELRSADLYLRRYARGERLVLGLGEHAQAGIVRFTWPNGIDQHLFDVPAGASPRPLQVERTIESCPFLYTFDGTRFRFITDVLGNTPLGLPLDAEHMVPFDHEEYVRVPGELLVPVDGELRLAITEELREVTYLDRLRLHAIDHPADVEMQPDEAFTFPPFPPAHVHMLARLLRPTHAIANLAADGPFGWGSSDRADGLRPVPRTPLLPAPPLPEPGVDAARDARGMARSEAVDASRLARPYDESAEPLAPGGPLVDVAAWVAEVDTRGPRPFKLAPDRLEGLTRPWSLDLHFGADDAERAAIRAAKRLRLVLTGWIQWGDASVNMAAARDPDWNFVPPVLWLPSGDGWRPSGPPFGFPAGKTKTMILDVTDLLVRDDPRLRLVTSLELTWDRIALAVDDDSTPYLDTPLEAATAQLTYRGFSGALATGREDTPEVFTWETRGEPLWNQHAGRYTRYGDVLPLLASVDDAYVLLGAGDVIHVTFDARALPELPAGWTRDWLVFCDGWAKDGNPNTHGGDAVGPLPFHGMSRYPPPADEQPADPDARARWDAEWNTREGRRLIPELVSRDR